MSIEHSGSIMLVDIDMDGQGISALMISPQEIPRWLHTGSPIDVIFKETEVSLGKNVTGSSSVLNQLSGVVDTVTRGGILSIVTVACSGHTITSAITTRSADVLQIKPHDSVTAFVDANEITLSDRKG